MVETLRTLFIEGTHPTSKTWKHARSKEPRYTYPAFPSKHLDEALRQPPARAKPPAHLSLTTSPQGEDRFPLIRSLLVRDRAEQRNILQAKALLPKSLRMT